MLNTPVGGRRQTRNTPKKYTASTRLHFEKQIHDYIRDCSKSQQSMRVKNPIRDYRKNIGMLRD